MTGQKIDRHGNKADSPFDLNNLTDQEQGRLEKLAALKEAGINPYPARVERTHSIAAARAAQTDQEKEEEVIWVTGRLVLRRDLGRMSFGTIDDGTGTIQIMVRRNLVDKEWFNNVWGRLIDLGDSLSVQGSLITTRTGELTIEALQVVLASKSLKPLPDKWHGLQDPETRYRRRHVDMVANPNVRQVFSTRALVVKSLRKYLDGTGFLEVETPVLQPIYGGAAAQPFVTHHNQLHQNLFLRISFELYLKRLIVGGFDKVYEIGRDFRNEGVSFKHNPEFTQLEFYEAYTDYLGVMSRLEKLIVQTLEIVQGGTTVHYQDKAISFAPPWPRKTLASAIEEKTDLNINVLTTKEELRSAMNQRGMDAAPDAHWGKLVDYLLSNFVEPDIVEPVFLLDYPQAISPFAKQKPDHPHLVERFELFAVGMELANAFTEINDPQDQYQRFVDENYRGEQGDEEASRMDLDFIEALTWGMPPTGGCGLGIDRFVMLLTDKTSIREVIPFPHLRQPQPGHPQN